MGREIAAGDRRLPVYLVIDTSYSMEGEPINAVQQGVNLLVDDLQADPMALDTVWLSVITFDSTAKQISPLTEIGDFQVPNLVPNGLTALGDGLTVLKRSVGKEVRKQTANQQGDWKPMIFLMTDGEPTDSWQGPANDLKANPVGNIIACAAGPHANSQNLKQITDRVIELADASSGTLGAFMGWVTQSIKTTSASVQAQGQQAIALPALPADQGIVIVP